MLFGVRWLPWCKINSCEPCLYFRRDLVAAVRDGAAASVSARYSEEGWPESKLTLTVLEARDHDHPSPYLYRCEDDARTCSSCGRIWFMDLDNPRPSITKNK